MMASMARKRSQPVAPRLPADDPQARDEGPRLIPHDAVRIEVPGASHYLDLADQALGLKKSVASQRTKRRSPRMTSAE